MTGSSPVCGSTPPSPPPWYGSQGTTLAPRPPCGVESVVYGSQGARRSPPAPPCGVGWGGGVGRSARFKAISTIVDFP